MLKVGLIGLGCMGTCHFNQYKLMEKNGVPVKLTAICDVDDKRLTGTPGVAGNMDFGGTQLDLSSYTLYNDLENMLENEQLDYVDICVPTYLHGPLAITAMEKGIDAFCEKPMAISSKVCDEMIACARRTGRKHMIGHTLRYWNAYVIAKQYIDEKKFGECNSAYFFRGGNTPIWSFENWLLCKEKSGGCLLDQHVHDVDTINWMFGMPEGVSSLGKVCITGSGYDAVSTNYLYPDGKVVNAQDDWTINGQGFGFTMMFRINFEKGALVFEKNELTIYPQEGETYKADMDPTDAYYKEMHLFSQLVSGEVTFDYIALLESHRDTIRLAEAEERSADQKGAFTTI